MKKKKRHFWGKERTRNKLRDATIARLSWRHDFQYTPAVGQMVNLDIPVQYIYVCTQSAISAILAYLGSDEARSSPRGKCQLPFKAVPLVSCVFSPPYYSIILSLRKIFPFLFKQKEEEKNQKIFQPGKQGRTHTHTHIIITLR